MVFVPALTSFVISDLLGGGKVLLIGNVIEQEFMQGSNWNLGSGLSVVLMIFVIASMAVMNILIKIREELLYGKEGCIPHLSCGHLLFLYLPILVLVVLSFNNSKSRVVWGGFTLKWYASCFTDKTIMNALIMTLQITLCAAVLSTLIGTLAAIGISAMKNVAPH